MIEYCKRIVLVKISTLLRYQNMKDMSKSRYLRVLNTVKALDKAVLLNIIVI